VGALDDFYTGRPLVDWHKTTQDEGDSQTLSKWIGFCT